MKQIKFKPITDLLISDYKNGDIILLSNNGIHTEIQAYVVDGTLMSGYESIDPYNYDFFMLYWRNKS